MFDAEACGAQQSSSVWDRSMIRNMLGHTFFLCNRLLNLDSTESKHQACYPERRSHAHKHDNSRYSAPSDARPRSSKSNTASAAQSTPVVSSPGAQIVPHSLFEASSSQPVSAVVAPSTHKSPAHCVHIHLSWRQVFVKACGCQRLTTQLHS